MKYSLKNISTLDRKLLRQRYKECEDEFKKLKEVFRRSKLIGKESWKKEKTIAEDQRGRVHG